MVPVEVWMLVLEFDAPPPPGDAAPWTWMGCRILNVCRTAAKAVALSALSTPAAREWAARRWTTNPSLITPNQVHSVQPGELRDTLSRSTAPMVILKRALELDLVELVTHYEVVRYGGRHLRPIVFLAQIVCGDNITADGLAGSPKCAAFCNTVLRHEFNQLTAERRTLPMCW